MPNPIKYDLGIIDHQESLERGKKKKQKEKREQKKIDEKLRKEKEIEESIKAKKEKEESDIIKEEERKEELRKKSDIGRVIGVFHFAGGQFEEELFNKGSEQFPPPFIVRHHLDLQANRQLYTEGPIYTKIDEYKFSLRNIEPIYSDNPDYLERHNRITEAKMNCEQIGICISAEIGEMMGSLKKDYGVQAHYDFIRQE